MKHANELNHWLKSASNWLQSTLRKEAGELCTETLVTVSCGNEPTRRATCMVVAHHQSAASRSSKRRRISSFERFAYKLQPAKRQRSSRGCAFNGRACNR
jgi:hypothetical protein